MAGPGRPVAPTNKVFFIVPSVRHYGRDALGAACPKATRRGSNGYRNRSTALSEPDLCKKGLESRLPLERSERIPGFEEDRVALALDHGVFETGEGTSVVTETHLDLRQLERWHVGRLTHALELVPDVVRKLLLSPSPVHESQRP